MPGGSWSRSVGTRFVALAPRSTCSHSSPAHGLRSQDDHTQPPPADGRQCRGPTASRVARGRRNAQCRGSAAKARGVTGSPGWNVRIGWGSYLPPDGISDDLVVGGIEWSAPWGKGRASVARRARGRPPPQRSSRPARRAPHRGAGRPGRVRLTGATRVLPPKVNHSRHSYPPDSTDADSDPADATRGYPPDSTDNSNSLNQIAF
jgi:hypothetical protein